ncbi:MAG: hypothetical protein GXY76_08765 [Chloroflexi bacterium]|nr:hypothetical protein [Chloroflexota bacterium]
MQPTAYPGTLKAVWGDDTHVYVAGVQDYFVKYALVGTTLTASFSSQVAKALAWYIVRGLDVLDKIASATGAGTTPSSGATAAQAAMGNLAVGAIGMEEQTDEAGTWTTGSGYVEGNPQIAGSTSGGAKAITIMTVAEVLAETAAQTAAQTGTLGNDWAAAVATYLATATSRIPRPPAAIDSMFVC